MPSVYDWSLTSSSNSNADSGINWAEGQAPSTVNNSARVMMSRIKALLNDLGGVSVATGTANSITVSASAGFSALGDGLRVTFRASSANTSATTLNVNGLGSKPAVKFTSSGEASLDGGEIQANGIYEVIYSQILNGAAGAWLLINPSETDVAPPGSGVPYFGGVIPSGWLLCNGAAVSRTTYARLFTAIGVTWGIGDGTTTFNIPDAREDFIRGASTTLALGTRQTDGIKAHTHTGTTASSGAHTHPIPDGATGGGSGAQNGPPTGGTFNTQSAGAHTHTFTTDSTGITETRPRNIAANWIIKT